MKRVYVVIMLIGLLATGVWVGSAQEAGAIPGVTIEATAEGFALPEEMPEGIVQITFENKSEALIGPTFARLNEGVTLEGLFAAIEEQGQEAFLQQLALLGYLEVMPGDIGDAIFDFAPGEYLFLNFPGDEPQEIIPFTVADVEAEAVAAPEADVEVTLVDFAFDVPIEISAGPQRWHIQNQGTQPHEFFLFRLEDDVPIGAFNARLLRALAGDEGAFPESGIFWIASPGEQAWITYDLEPGTYGLVCALPDLTGSGHVHAELGMRQIITVSG